MIAAALVSVSPSSAQEPARAPQAAKKPHVVASPNGDRETSKTDFVPGGTASVRVPFEAVLPPTTSAQSTVKGSLKRESLNTPRVRVTLCPPVKAVSCWRTKTARSAFATALSRKAAPSSPIQRWNAVNAPPQRYPSVSIRWTWTMPRWPAALLSKADSPWIQA